MISSTQPHKSMYWNEVEERKRKRKQKNRKKDLQNKCRNNIHIGMLTYRRIKAYRSNIFTK